MHETALLRVTVAGGGSWGTALAHVLRCKGHAVHLLMRDADAAHRINTTHENARYLPGHTLADGITAVTDAACLRQSDVLVLAVPCQKLRQWLQQVQAHVPQRCVVVNAAKGIEAGSTATVSQMVHEVWAHRAPRYAIVSGPSFAAEVITAQPTAVVLGCADDALGVRLRAAFSSDVFRCYSCSDVLGVELGGALKNVMAIAAGMCDGLGFGHNARAALITRGLAEMSRVGVAMGAQARTFMGLSGLGDLTLTCTGDLSRNRQVGLRLGRGEGLEAIVQSLGMVAEGVTTTSAVYNYAHRAGLATPITDAMYGIMYAGHTAREAVTALMTRALKEE